MIEKSSAVKLFDVLRTNRLRQTTYDPFMSKRLLCSDSLSGVPAKASFYQVKEGLIAVWSQNGIPIHDFLNFVLLLDWRNANRVILGEELLPSLRLLYHLHWRHAQQLNEHQHLLILVLAGEEGNASMEFNKDAPEGPYINSGRVLDAEHDFRSSIKPALDVGVYLLSLEAPAAHVDNLKSALVLLLQQDILGLKITMYDRMAVKEVERLQDLDGEPSNQIQGKAQKVILLDELIKVFAEHFEFKAGVPSELKGALETHNVIAQFGVVQEGSLQNLYFHAGLHVKLLLVFYYLQGNHFFLLVVQRLKHPSKRSPSQVPQYLVLVCD